MLFGILQALGGLGLFLLGMVIMTDGLRRLTGRFLRHTLTRFTHNPTSGAITGAVSTAILQSSSATTIAAVSFVSAGLLTFPQALGIVFGANLGTTITGWLVALLGFKFKLGSVVLPLIFFGVLLRLFGRGKVASSGLALAGFSLIFVGITQLQAVMQGMEGILTPEIFPGDTWIGRLQLVAIGMAITLVTQSSSAGVATAITAVYTGAISFPQAAAMVIGMDVATTVKAVIATIGGGLESRRTAYSHVMYNLFTAAFALLFLTPFIWLWENFITGDINTHAEIALVAFHSSFNLIGISLMLPFAHPFAHMIERMTADKQQGATQRLDRMLLEDAASATQAIRLTLNELTIQLMEQLALRLEQKKEINEHLITTLDNQLAQTHRYIDELHLSPAENIYWMDLLHSIHTIDHLTRLCERCEEDADRINLATRDSALQSYSMKPQETVKNSLTSARENNWDRAARQMEEIASYLRVDDHDIRGRLMEDVAQGLTDVPYGVDRLEAIRSLRRVSSHMSRILLHLRALNDPNKHNFNQEDQRLPSTSL